MSDIFINLLNMSITASWIIFAIVLLRLIFKKAPKKFFCFLWILAGLRLIFPFSIESTLSLIPSTQTVPQNISTTDSPEIQSGFMYVNQAVNSALYPMTPNPGDSINPMQIVTSVAGYVWLAGLVGLLLYALVSYLKLRKKVSVSINTKDNIFICDYIETPFILGIFKPRIYLPSSMSEEQISHVIAHEKAHLKRCDHYWKPLGFLLLSVYWFNPVIWLAYILLCRDIELACDERVIKKMGNADIKAYSEALLECSIPRHAITACPVAFGETGVKGRIKAVLNYKKPAFWVIIIAVIVTLVLTVCFMTNPLGMKLTELCSFDPSSSIFCTITSPKVTYSIWETEEVSQVYSILKEIRVEKTPLDENENVERYRINSISFAGKMIFYFNADCTEVWINNEGEPSYLYKVKNPESLTQFFDKKFNTSAVAYKSGTETEGITIKLNAIDLEDDKPYIKVEYINDTDFEFGHDAKFMIYRIENGEKVSCAKDGLVFIEPYYVLLPHSSVTDNCSLEYFDLSKPGIYRFEKEYTIISPEGDTGPYISWIEFEVTVEPEFEVTRNSAVTEKPHTTGAVFFYNKPTIEYQNPHIKSYGTFYKNDFEIFLSSLKNKKWIFDGVTDRINFNYDGKIYCYGWIYFGYEQKVAYYDQYYCTLSDKEIKTLKEIQSEAVEYSADLSSVNISGNYEEYVFENSVDPVDPKLYLQTDEKTFIFSWSVFNSYYATGTYRWEDDTLILSADDKINGYVFEKENNTLIFDGQSSSSIPEYKYSGANKAAQSPVPDGAVFALK